MCNIDNLLFLIHNKYLSLNNVLHILGKENRNEYFKYTLLSWTQQGSYDVSLPWCIAACRQHSSMAKAGVVATRTHQQGMARAAGTTIVVFSGGRVNCFNFYHMMCIIPKNDELFWRTRGTIMGPHDCSVMPVSMWRKLYEWVTRWYYLGQ